MKKIALIIGSMIAGGIISAVHPLVHLCVNG